MIAIGNPNTRRTRSASLGTYYMRRERTLLARLTLMVLARIGIIMES